MAATNSFGFDIQFALLHGVAAEWISLGSDWEAAVVRCLTVRSSPDLLMSCGTLALGYTVCSNCGALKFCWTRARGTLHEESS